MATNPNYRTYNRLEARAILWDNPRLNETEIDKFYAQQGIKNLKKNLLLYLSRVVENWQFLFWQNTSLDLSVFTIIFSLVGFILSFLKKNSKGLILFVFFLFFCGQYTLLFTYPRFRMPLDWILFLFAAYSIYLFISKLSKFLLKKEFYFSFKKFLEIFLNKKFQIQNKLLQYLTIIGLILILQYLIQISIIYVFPKKITQLTINNSLVQEILEKHNLIDTWNLENQKGVIYQEIYRYQKDHHGEITPFLGQMAIWKGELSYLNRNAVYPLGSAKVPENNESPEYKDFYDIYFLPSTAYSTFDLIVNRGEKAGYYGDGVAMINYKGLLDFSFNNGNQVAIIGKIIGQNIFGQIYLEAYGVFK